MEVSLSSFKENEYDQWKWGWELKLLAAFTLSITIVYLLSLKSGLAETLTTNFHF